MKRVHLLLAALVISILAGCGGGGGGGGTATAIGRILNVQTGLPPNPQATVSLGGGTPVTTSAVDGSFAATGPNGSSQLAVNAGPLGSTTFTIPSVSGTEPIGDFWVGPQVTTLRGRVLNATDGTVVSGATVSFAGRMGRTNSSGVFSLTNVAYSSSDQSVFWGIVGTIADAGFVTANFTAAPFTDNGGITDIGDQLIQTTSDPNPPGDPYTIYGRVLAQGGPSGAVITLKLNGTPQRVVNVGSDGNYYFWVGPGNYTISYQLGLLTAPDQVANLTQSNQVIHIPDVTLH